MKREYTVLAIGVISVSFAAIFIRLAEAPPLVIATYRLVLASVVVIPFALARSGHEITRLSRREKLLSVLSGAFLAAHFYFWITSLTMTTVATSVVLVTSVPIFVAVASWILFDERIQSRTVHGIIITIVGTLIIGYVNWKAGPVSLEGSLLALAGALMAGGYMLTGRRLRRNMGLLSYISLSYGTAAVILLIATLLSGYGFTGYSGQTYLMMILLALVPQVIGHSSLNWSLRYMPATLVTIAVLGEPVGATLLAMPILHETPSPLELAGGLLILAGIYVALRGSRSAHRQV